MNFTTVAASFYLMSIMSILPAACIFIVFHCISISIVIAFAYVYFVCLTNLDLWLQETNKPYLQFTEIVA